MANDALYNDALEKFRQTYGMPEYDLKELETTDLQLAYLNNTAGSTSAQKFVRLAASTASMYFESLTNLKSEGSKKLIGFDGAKFLKDFEDLAKARYQSQLEGDDKGDREPFAGADKEDIKKAITDRANYYNKPLPNLWFEQLKLGHLKIEKARYATNDIYDKLTKKDAKKEEMGGLLRDFVAAREAMRQLRESRKGFAGFFWKLFNREQNRQEKELLGMLEYGVRQLEDVPYNYTVEDLRSAVVNETPWEKEYEPFYRTKAISAENDIEEIKEEELEEKTEKEKTVDDNNREPIEDEQLQKDVNGNQTQEFSEPMKEEITIASPQKDIN